MVIYVVTIYGSTLRYYIHLLEQNLTDPSIQRIQHYKHPDNINTNTFNIVKHTIYLHSNAYNRNIINMFKFSAALRSSQLTTTRNVSWKILVTAVVKVQVGTREVIIS